MKNISLFGYGSTTKALARHLKKEDCIVTFYDDKVNKHFSDEHGFKVKNSSEFTPKYSQLELPSPGIAPHHPLIKEAKHLISEYDFFAKKLPYSIWVSGTNGKTTTTQMITHMLDDKDAQAGGNIGVALGNMDQSKAIWVLETSSFTLHYTNEAKPNIYVLLPVSDDHLSWHGSFEAYEEAKLKPLQTMCEGEVAILPSKYRDIQSDAFCIYYDSVEELLKYFDFDILQINYKGGFLLDAVMALAVDKILYDRINYEKINNFTLDKHRQEKIIDSQNRVWINDSKATNVDATIAALNTFEGKKLHLILGGDDKGADLTPLFYKLEGRDVTLYFIGKNSKKLASFAKSFKLNFEISELLSTAVSSIHIHHSKKSIALLSPAAASLDQFTNYQDRGENFRKLIKKLSTK